MEAILRKAGFGFALGVAVLVAGIALQGCLLEEKTIIDDYPAIFGVAKSNTAVVNRMSFGASYCIQAGVASFGIKFDSFDPALTKLDLAAKILEGTTIVGQWDFPLQGGKGKFKGKFPVPAVCVEPGQTWEWSAHPVDGDILAGSAMRTKVKYKAGEGY